MMEQVSGGILQEEREFFIQALELLLQEGKITSEEFAEEMRILNDTVNSKD